MATKYTYKNELLTLVECQLVSQSVIDADYLRDNDLV